MRWGLRIRSKIRSKIRIRDRIRRRESGIGKERETEVGASEVLLLPQGELDFGSGRMSGFEQGLLRFEALVGLLEGTQSAEGVDVLLVEGIELENDLDRLSDFVGFGVHGGERGSGDGARQGGEILEMASEQPPGAEDPEGGDGNGDTKVLAHEVDDVAIAVMGKPVDDLFLLLPGEVFELGVGAGFGGALTRSFVGLGFHDGFQI